MPSNIWQIKRWILKMDSLSPVCRWRAEPRVQATSPESPGRQVQTSSSCSPSETAWRTGGGGSEAQPDPRGLRGGAESTPRRYRGRRDEESATKLRGTLTADQIRSAWNNESRGGGGGRNDGSRQSVWVQLKRRRHWSWWEDLQLEIKPEHFILVPKGIKSSHLDPREQRDKMCLSV